MSPSMSKTICLPSGLTSTVIHVPRLTSILTSWCSPGGSSTFHLPGDAPGVFAFVDVPEPVTAPGCQRSSGSPPCARDGGASVRRMTAANRDRRAACRMGRPPGTRGTRDSSKPGSVLPTRAAPMGGPLRNDERGTGHCGREPVRRNRFSLLDSHRGYRSRGVWYEYAASALVQFGDMAGRHLDGS